MKPSLCLFIFTGTIAGLPAVDQAGPEVEAIGMLPNQRTAQRIAPSERNPFAFKPKETVKAAEDTETQESRIRAIFKLMSVSGIREGNDGRLMALVGDLILRAGEEVKPVLNEQTELLMVSKIDRKKVELTFVETKDSTQPRTIVMPIEGQTRVGQRLFGQPKGGKTIYFPALRTAAAGVASVVSAAGGRGLGTAVEGETEAGEESRVADASRVPSLESTRPGAAALAPAVANPAPVQAAGPPAPTPPATGGAPSERNIPKAIPVLVAPPPAAPKPVASPTGAGAPAPAPAPAGAVRPAAAAPSAAAKPAVPPPAAPRAVAVPPPAAPAPSAAAPAASKGEPPSPGAPAASKPATVRLAVPPPAPAQAPAVVE